MSQIIVPEAIDIEMAVLGAIMVENTAQDEAINQLSSELFSDPRHEMIFSAIRLIYDRGDKIDVFTIANILKINHELAKIGGVAYLIDVTQKIGSATNIADHIRILIEKKCARELQVLGSKLFNCASSLPLDELISDLTTVLDKVSMMGISQGEMKRLRDTLIKAIAEAEIRASSYLSGKMYGITTGVRALDNMINGWQKSELTVIAARPAMGKTAVSIHFAKSAAIGGNNVLIFELEMSEVKLSDRLILSECESLTYSDFRRGKINQIQWNEINRAQDRLSKLPILIDATASTTVRHIVAKAAAKKRKGQCDMVIVDYLQLINNTAAVKGRNREQEVAEISKALKQMAKDLDIPVILLAQLNREAEKTEGARPRLFHLRESGAIEQDADNVIMLYRPEKYEIKEADGLSTEGLGVFYIEKQREGKIGKVLFGYNDSLTRIGDYDDMRAYNEQRKLGYDSNLDSEIAPY